MIKKVILTVILNLTMACVIGQNSFNFNDWVKEVPGIVIDIDSNAYHIQKIGNQYWFKENLKATKFNNGNEIQRITSDSLWSISQVPSFSTVTGSVNYADGADSMATKEMFYNYFVVSDTQNVCPIGWKVPDTSEWHELVEYINQANDAFMSMIYPPNIEDTLDNNQYWAVIYEIGDVGFSSAPFGYRNGRTGEFWLYRDYGYWWSTDLNFNASAWSRFTNRGLGIDDVHLEENRGNAQSGYSIKCIQE